MIGSFDSPMETESRSDVRLVGFEFFFRPGSHGRLLAGDGKRQLVNRVLAQFVRRAPRSPPNSGKVHGWGLCVGVWRACVGSLGADRGR